SFCELVLSVGPAALVPCSVFSLRLRTFRRPAVGERVFSADNGSAWPTGCPQPAVSTDRYCRKQHGNADGPQAPAQSQPVPACVLQPEPGGTDPSGWSGFLAGHPGDVRPWGSKTWQTSE